MVPTTHREVQILSSEMVLPLPVLLHPRYLCSSVVRNVSSFFSSVSFCVLARTFSSILGFPNLLQNRLPPGGLSAWHHVLTSMLTPCLTSTQTLWLFLFLSLSILSSPPLDTCQDLKACLVRKILIRMSRRFCLSLFLNSFFFFFGWD